VFQKLIFHSKQKKKKNSIASSDADKDKDDKLKNNNLSRDTNKLFAESRSMLGNDDEELTVASRAKLEMERRKKEGNAPLVISPLSNNSRLLHGSSNSDSTDKNLVHDDGKAKDENGIKDKINEKKDEIDDKDDESNEEDAFIIAQLVEEANGNANRREKKGELSSSKGKTIEMIPNDNGERINITSQQNVNKEDETFQEDLTKMADDIPITSDAYVSVPISEFGAAMLRGMGWKGDEDNENNTRKKSAMNPNSNDVVIPRHHRLGLGATPMPLSLKSSSKTSSNGITTDSKRHRAIRKPPKPGEINKLQQEEEEELAWKAKLEEKRQNDKQITLQIGSIVYINSLPSSSSSFISTKQKRRAKLNKIQGVPGLNRVLIELEYYDEGLLPGPLSVKKSDIALVPREELDKIPFKDALVDNSDKVGKKESRGKSNRNESKINTMQKRIQHDEERGEDRMSNRHQRDLDQSRSKRRRRSLRSCSHSRSRSGDRNTKKRRSREQKDYDVDKRLREEMTRDDRRKDKHKSERRNIKDLSKQEMHRRQKENERHQRGKYDEYDRYTRQNQDDDTIFEKHEKIVLQKEKRNGSKSITPKESKSKYEEPSQSWLIPNIRVRVVSRKYAKGRHYKQKGIIVDALHGGRKAVLHMTNGEVLDCIPERYLETALPAIGGNAIVLTGQHKYEKGVLIEKNLDKGEGVIQLFEDMHVVSLLLDDIAEWCGSLDEDQI